MKAVILAAGQGTRLRPVTLTMPKPLVPVANQPLIHFAVEVLKNAGLTEIGIVVNDLDSPICAQLGDGEALGVQLSYIVQAEQRGLAHAIGLCEEFVDGQPFSVYLGDNIFQDKMETLLREFPTSGADVTIALGEVSDPTRFGIAEIRDGKILRVVEKPKEPPSNLAIAGVYLFQPAIFDSIRRIKPSWRNELEITDAIQWLIDRGYVVSPHVHQGWWIDTGKPTDMLEANCYVLDEIKPHIAPDAVIENSEVDARVTVEAGARIINSIVHGPTIIGENCVIENSYVGPYTSIYHHVTVSNCEIDRSIILEHCTLRDLDVRLYGSLIGRNVTLQHKDEKPRTLSMNLGDYSSVWMV